MADDGRMYVIDGHNLFHKLIPLGIVPKDYAFVRNATVKLIDHAVRRENTRARVYFDGSGIVAGTQRVRVIPSGIEREAADRAIREYVETHNHPHKLVVVTSDREVLDSARVAGARSMRSEAFARRLENLPGRDRYDAPSQPEKPARGNSDHDIEREMLDDIGDLEEFERRIIRGEE